MSRKSFYSLEYVIEINEKRIEEYKNAYQHLLGRFTDIIIIYSAISVFLIPLCQEMFLSDGSDGFMKGCFSIFCVLFGLSVLYTVRFIIPVHVGNLEPPERYYREALSKYENKLGSDLNMQDSIVMLLQASYIMELESTLRINIEVYSRKKTYYSNALILGLLSSVPFIVCLWFYILKKEK